MANTIGSLVVVLEANIARYQANMQTAAQGTEVAMDRMKGAAGLVAGAVALIGVSLTVDGLLEMANAAIDALGNLDDMAQKTGSSVENLSRLSQVATATGADFTAVDAVLQKFAKGMNNVDDEGSKVRKGMSALGLSTKNLKDQDPSLQFIEIAKRLQDYEDGVSKTALVMDILGKKGADLLPYLNDVADYVDKFTGVSAEAASAAAKYQDQLGFLKARNEAFATQIVGQAMPAMTAFMGAFTDVTTEVNGLTQVNVSVWSDNLAIAFAAVVDVAILIPKIISAIGGSFKVVYADISTIVSGIKNLNPISLITDASGSIAEFSKDAVARNKVVEDANQELHDLWYIPANKMEQGVRNAIASRNTGSEDSIDAMSGLLTNKKDAKKPLKYAGEKEADAMAAKAKRMLDDQLRSIDNALAKQQSALEFGNKYIAELRDQDLIDLDAYNDYRQKAVDSALAISIKAYDAEIAALKKHQGNAKKVGDVDADQTSIDGLEAKKIRAVQDADQESTMLKLGLTKAQSGLNKVAKEWTIQQGLAADQMQFEIGLMGKSALEVAKLTSQRRIALDVEEKIRAAKEKGNISDEAIANFRKAGEDQSSRVDKTLTQGIGQQIGDSLQTPAQTENEQHGNRLKDLQAFRDAELENAVEGNRLIEEETRRHEETMASMKAQSAQSMLSLAQSSADNLYSALQAAGLEQTALGKAMFFAQKAVQVATIIVNTEVAAAAAQAGMIAAAGATAAVSGPAGPAILTAGIAAGAGFAAVTRAMGYATAGLVAGTALAGAREKGGPVWDGGAFLVGETGPEIFRPPSHGTIVPNSKIGGGGDSEINFTIVNNTRSIIGQVTEQRISPTERALIIEEAGQAYSAQLGDPGSKASKAMGRHFKIPRSRE